MERGAALLHLWRRHGAWLGLAAVLAPLAVLLGLQYRWLLRLDETSAIARRATLANYLEAVAAEVELTYRSEAERALNLPAALFTLNKLEKAAYHFKKKPVIGARRLFVVSFLGERAGMPLYFDSATATLSEPSWSPEVRAVLVATASWKLLAHKGGPVEPALAVEERDPAHRIVLNPITDDQWKLVGVAGMILDEDHLRCALLPGAVAKSLPRFFGDHGQDYVVTVRDGHGRLVSGPPGPLPAPDEVERPLNFAFADWRLGLSSRHGTLADLARSNFELNVALSAALALVLLGGVLLTLRSAARSMRLSQMKSDFVSNVSHELRTPLASIRVFGELLRLGRVEGGEKTREYGEYIENESRRLTRLVNNILDFSRIESGRKEYRHESADLEEVVAETLRSFEPTLRHEGFRVTFERPAAPLPALSVDAGAIAQSVANLIDNAVKYSNGARDIEVGLRREGRDGEWAVVWVRDHGVGIPRDEQRKIFERFHRVSTGLVHDVKGAGLGLAIVRHILEAHGGRVTVDSRPGAGSTFSLYLPIPPSVARDAPLAGPTGPPRERPAEA
jgi:signal transduction histidine kinase